ncbi:hypothetical protein [Xylanibacter rodentium]|uniref:hypothetical protein n=1 Tax=Xylanibacter rodentium TaxID=2736289 RepID=UPI0025960663|nr:hypothetical protein [Xylanibacter rodentium]
MEILLGILLGMVIFGIILLLFIIESPKNQEESPKNQENSEGSKSNPTFRYETQCGFPVRIDRYVYDIDCNYIPDRIDGVILFGDREVPCSCKYDGKVCQPLQDTFIMFQRAAMLGYFSRDISGLLAYQSLRDKWRENIKLVKVKNVSDRDRPHNRPTSSQMDAIMPLLKSNNME